MERENLICIYATLQQDEISFIKSLLDSANIAYYIVQENPSVQFANALDRQMRVMISSNDAKDAKELLKDFLKEKT
jgi:hypothetical protein